MNRFRWIALLVAVAVVAFAAWLWFSPFGSGEYADSPDKRYRASAYNSSRGTWFQGREAYISVEVVESSTGRVVWKAERYPVAGDVPPEYGDRSKKFIKWSADSRAVSIPVGGPADAIWVVP